MLNQPPLHLCIALKAFYKAVILPSCLVMSKRQDSLQSQVLNLTWACTSNTSSLVSDLAADGSRPVSPGGEPLQVYASGFFPFGRLRDPK